MRILVTLIACLPVFMLAGCDSVGSLPGRVQERFEAPQPKMRVFAAEQRTVFDAAQRAVKAIDFIVGRAGAAKGIIEAHSPLHSTAAFGKARQYTIEVKMQSTGPGETEVAVVLREQEESESFAGATDIPLREHALYESFFQALEAELGLKGTAIPPPASGS